MREMMDHRVKNQNRKLTIQKTGNSESVYESPGTPCIYEHYEHFATTGVFWGGHLTVDCATHFHAIKDL